jgi:hypothetical protein
MGCNVVEVVSLRNVKKLCSCKWCRQYIRVQQDGRSAEMRKYTCWLMVGDGDLLVVQWCQWWC